MQAHEPGATTSRRTGEMSASHDSVRTAFSPGVCPRPAKPPGLFRARHLVRCCLACLLVLAVPEVRRLTLAREAPMKSLGEEPAA